MRYRCAVLDDYQNVATTLADWGKIAGDVDVKVFTKPMSGPDEVHRVLKDFDIVCMMRERTPFRRNTIEALPNLKLLITTGARNASIDMAAAAERYTEFVRETPDEKAWLEEWTRADLAHRPPRSGRSGYGSIFRA